MKRREFLAATGGVALSALSSRRVLGANDRLGVALVGSGRRGREVMRAFLQSGRAELRCVVKKAARSTPARYAHPQSTRKDTSAGSVRAMSPLISAPPAANSGPWLWYANARLRVRQ